MRNYVDVTFRAYIPEGEGDRSAMRVFASEQSGVTDQSAVTLHQVAARVAVNEALLNIESEASDHNIEVALVALTDENGNPVEMAPTFKETDWPKRVNPLREQVLARMWAEVKGNLPEGDAGGGATIEYVVAEHTFESRQVGIEEFCTAKVEERKYLADAEGGGFHTSPYGTVHADLYNGNIAEDTVWIEPDEE